MGQSCVWVCGSYPWPVVPATGVCSVVLPTRACLLLPGTGVVCVPKPATWGDWHK